jgi:hypothetical protein
MLEENLKNWDEFEKAICQIEADYEKKKAKTTMLVSDLLYRGQPDSKMLLETTLERAVQLPVSMGDYYRLIRAARSRIETFTDKDWNIPSAEQYEQWLETQEHTFILNYESYNYFVYLRHHGFPSPLLDWTASPYLAAFFAMHKVAKSVENVSVYVLCESASGIKITSSNDPVIHGLGPNVKAHRRHYLQQSQYTICTESKNGKIVYARHEDVVSMNSDTQDQIWKFNLPVSERVNFLTKLNKMNINSFSLFETADSLMDTIATNDILLDNRYLKTERGRLG